MTPNEIQQAIDRLLKLLNTSQFTDAKAIANVLLEQQVPQEDVETTAKIYNILGIVHTNLSDFPKALEYYLKALQINEKNGFKEGTARNLGNIGLVYKDLSDYSIAFEYFSKALIINEELGRKTGIASNIGNIGLVYYCLSEYSKALEYYSKALYIDEEIGNKYGIANNFINIGNVYWNLSDYPKALEYNFKSLHINEEIGDKLGFATVVGNIANVYNSLSDFSKAIEYYSKALLINEEIGDKNSFARNLGNIGNVYDNLSDHPKAFENYKKALDINEEIGNKRGIARNFSNIGSVYINKESSFYNPKKAEEYLQKSIQLAEEIGAKDILQDSYILLHLFRQNEKQFEEAIEYYKKSVEIEKEIQSEDATNTAQKFDQRRKIEEDEKVRLLKLARFQEQEKLLHNILPVNIANRIIQQETFIADFFESVSVLFMDLVGFTSLASIAPPKQLVYLLDVIFQKADEIVENFGLEKIKTIGDGYLAVANVTSPLEHHQNATAQAALQLLETMKDFVVNIPSDLGETDWIKDMNDLEIRIGIHTGEVVAGIIGKNKYTYDLWGDAVNVASRMESNSEAGRIHISEAFATSIKEHPEFKLIPRGEINIKGKGTMNTFWLEKSL